MYQSGYEGSCALCTLPLSRSLRSYDGFAILLKAAQAAHSFRGHVHEGNPKARGNVGRDAAEIRRMALAGAAFFDVAMVQGTCLRNPSL